MKTQSTLFADELIGTRKSFGKLTGVFSWTEINTQTF